MVYKLPVIVDEDGDKAYVYNINSIPSMSFMSLVNSNTSNTSYLVFLPPPQQLTAVFRIFVMVADDAAFVKVTSNIF